MTLSLTEHVKTFHHNYQPESEFLNFFSSSLRFKKKFLAFQKTLVTLAMNDVKFETIIEMII